MISFSKKSKTLSANNNANKSICAALHAADTAPANTISVSVQNGEIVCNSSVTNGSIPKPGGDVHTNNTAFRLDHFENLYFHPQLPADATNVQVAVSLTDKTDSLKLRWNNAVLPSAAAGQRIDIPQDKVKTEGNVLRITATGNTLSVESVTFYFAVPYLVGELLELVIENMKYRFHYCPAGAFTMGSPLSEAERRKNEQLHPVTLSQGFWMGETEVTQEQWESIMGNNPSHFKGEKLPVECVSWNACQEFVNKLNALGAAPKGYKFSLPTEAQWEYACRSGTSGAYAGDLDKMAWYEDNSGEKTHEVGTKQANAWGLYDMHGNVWEWCNDWYRYYPTGSVTDPIGASSGSDRVYRGGSWFDFASHCRSAIRLSSAPVHPSYRLGVRVSLVSGQ